ncbi:MAG: hypothetical protein J6I96_00430 [Oscillospiraceae bacterium]|nr:hypothetical protein [Oscillospiraceae bacterium]
MKIIYSSESRIYCIENGNKTEIPCERTEKYRQTVDSIRRRNEWKTSGRGAAFTGTARNYEDSSEVRVDLTGVCSYNDRIIYSLRLDESSCIYHRSADRSEGDEGLILSSNELYFGRSDFYDGKLAVSLGGSPSERHICVLEPPSSLYEEYTDGDSQELDPYFSRAHRDRIYFSSCGNARNENGFVTAVSNRVGAYLDMKSRTMTELLTDEKYDHISLKDNANGDLYYIRQPYSQQTEKSSFSVKDVFLLPVRLIKALGGWLNFMSVIWGGESLNGKDPANMLNERTKNRSERDMIIDGNIIKAEKLAKKNENNEDGLMPHERVLIKREADGEETTVAKGVLDFALADDGTVVYSDGRYIHTLSPDGSDSRIKAYLARNITLQ